MPLCPSCPRVRRPVPSIGPLPSRVLFLGEAPSYEDDPAAEPLTGKIGIEFNNTYLWLTGQSRTTCHLAHVRCCSEADYAPPTSTQALSCALVHLEPLLSKVRPVVIVTMGAVACSLFPEVGNINHQHGIPLVGRWGSWQGILFPTYHPSAGMKPGAYMIPLTTDFYRLGELLKELPE